MQADRTYKLKEKVSIAYDPDDTHQAYDVPLVQSAGRIAGHPLFFIVCFLATLLCSLVPFLEFFPFLLSKKAHSDPRSPTG
ncbi:hypothetical protein KSC_100860 [Ktedonobacter sp. SOSP1-52]|nr:hypothetical protein KSC_100860 [Ktedonobacter sp. SOSP1-52]